jgi:hypothetical protein
LRRLIRVPSPEKDPLGQIYGIALNADGLRLAVLGAGDVVVWDTDKPSQLFSWRGTDDGKKETAPRWRTVSLSPDGHWLALGGDRLLLVDLLSGRNRSFSTTQPFAPINFAWSKASGGGASDASQASKWQLAGMTSDGEIRVWSLARNPSAQTANPLNDGVTMPGRINDPRQIALTEDGRFIVVASQRGLHAWNVDRRRETPTFSGIDGPVYAFALGSLSGTPTAPRDRNYPVTTLSDGGLIRQWITDPNELVSRAFARVMRPLNADECKADLAEESCPSPVTGVEDVVRGIAASRTTGDRALKTAEESFGRAREKGILLPLPPAEMARRERADVLESAGLQLLRAHSDPFVELDRAREQRRDMKALELLKDARAARGAALDLYTVRRLVANASRQAADGRVDEALAALEAAPVLNKEAMLPSPALASELNNLCWFGTLAGRAMDVMPYCEAAVAMDDENGLILDSRGLARMCTGDTDSAIDDFAKFVMWTRDKKERDERQGWIAALRRSDAVNPCDDGTLLEQLRVR